MDSHLHTQWSHHFSSHFQVMFLWCSRRPFAKFAGHDPRQELHTHPCPSHLCKLLSLLCHLLLETLNHLEMGWKNPWEKPQKRSSGSCWIAAGRCQLSSSNCPGEKKPSASSSQSPQHLKGFPQTLSYCVSSLTLVLQQGTGTGFWNRDSSFKERQVA